MSIITNAQLKSSLGIPAAITYHDVRIGQVVDGANGYVLGQLGQASLAALTYTDYPEVAAEGLGDIQLKHVPVVSIAAVTNGISAVAVADFRLEADTGLVRLVGVDPNRYRNQEFWSTARDGVVITYLAGYTSANIPAQIKTATRMIASSWFNKSTHHGKKAERSSGHRIDLNEFEIPPAAQMILNDFVDVHHFGF